LNAGAPPMADELVVMGRVIGSYGIRGWVRVQPFTGTRDALLDYPEWRIATAAPGEWKRCRVLDGRLHGDGIVASVEGIATREEAVALKGSDVMVPREALPPVADDEVYLADLVGCNVVDRGGTLLGKVASVQDNGAQPVLIVAAGEGRQTLIPFVPAIVDEVDLVEGRIIVDWAAEDRG
jgi:16S rRNA processing protein RimM